jgi:hypothetical protein
VIVLDQQSSEALVRLANHADWPRFVALLDKTFTREVENMLGARDTNRVLHQQGYCQAMKDVLQAAMSAKPSLPSLG